MSLFFPSAPALSLKQECMARLDDLDRHVREARRVEASAHVREARAIADPGREEMRRINTERANSIAAAERGDVTTVDLAEAMRDLAKRLDRSL